MLILIIAFIVSLMPALFIFFLLRNRSEEPDHRRLYRKALVTGIVCTIFIVLLSGSLHIMGRILRIEDIAPIMYRVYYTVIVLALSEELVKDLSLLYIVRKNQYPYSWLDIISLMTIIGIGFGLCEDIPYAIGSGAIVMLVRGVTVMHGGFGFIAGWFFGKGIKQGNKGYIIIGFLIPWIMHGAYDLCLDKTILDINKNIGIVSVALAAAGLIIIILAIRFFIKARNDVKYTEPLAAYGSEERMY